MLIILIGVIIIAISYFVIRVNQEFNRYYQIVNLVGFAVIVFGSW